MSKLSLFDRIVKWIYPPVDVPPRPLPTEVPWPHPPTARFVLDGIVIPADHEDRRGPFYGDKCYLDGLVSLLHRDTHWEPVECRKLIDAVHVRCLGDKPFNQATINGIARHFRLPVGWALLNWSIGYEPLDEMPKKKRRLLQLELWLDSDLALAGADGVISDPVDQYLHWSRESVKQMRYNRS